MSKLGKGGFGTVTVSNSDPTVAVKSFSSTGALIREVVLLKYMADSSHVVEFLDFSLEKYEIRTRRWKRDLNKAMNSRERIPREKFMHITRQLLTVVANLARREIVHADIKASNVLVDDEYNICLCDLGLSGIGRYACVKKATQEYKPIRTRSGHGHDMNMLCLLILSLFTRGDYESNSPSKIRKIIDDKLSGNLVLCEVLKRMMPDSQEHAISAEDALEMLFSEESKLGYPQPVIYPSLLDKRQRRHIKNTIWAICAEYGINRSARCVESTINFFNEHREVKLCEYPRYMGAALVIFAQVFAFGETEFGIVAASSKCEVGREAIISCVDKMLRDNNFITLIMLPGVNS